jgi:peptide-methionine (R)-S-oxide reductase
MAETNSRRGFLLGALATPLVAACARAADEDAGKASLQAANVTIENFSAAGTSLGKTSVPRVVKTDDEWQKLLSPESYVVTRRAGTERPFSGKYNANHADGLYGCICCDTVLFDSKTKFESGTGWPSFWRAISSANVNEAIDKRSVFGYTEVKCRRCDAHLGHVFEDGPEPTGLRYCMNSVSLNFKPRGGGIR